MDPGYEKLWVKLLDIISFSLKNSFSLTQTKIQYRVYISQPLVPLKKRTNSVHVLISYSPNIHTDIIPYSTTQFTQVVCSLLKLLYQVFAKQISEACYILSLFHAFNLKTLFIFHKNKNSFAPFIASPPGFY